MARQVIGPKEEPNTIILLHGYSVKFTPNGISLYLYISESQRLSKKLLFVIDDINIETHKNKVQRMKK